MPAPERPTPSQASAPLSANEARWQFVAALRAAGLEPVKELALVDGVLERFRPGGDKAGSRNAWCVFHGGDMPAGAFGSWRTGATHWWRAEAPAGADPAQRAAHREQLQDLRRVRDAEQQRVRAAAAEKAARLWRLARPASEAHAYAARKRIRPYGVRQLRDMLVVPVRDVHGTLHSLQFIGADGAKRFLTGGRIAGCYCGIGKPQGKLLLGEGLATCCTLFEATGLAVAVCFHAGTLEPVACALRGKFPRLRLVVCADNDQATPGNPGVTHARAAACAVGGYLAVPDFSAVPS